MKDISAGIPYYNYINSRKIRSLFKNLPYELKIKDIKINEQKRGCSGFIRNTQTGKICYISTEFFFDKRSGSGLFGNKDKAILMRMAENMNDYKGGVNHLLPVSDIVSMAEKLTTENYK